MYGDSFHKYMYNKMVAFLQMIFSLSNAFLRGKKLYLNSNFSGVCFEGSNCPKVIIGLGNGLALNMQQPITLTIYD